MKEMIIEAAKLLIIFVLMGILKVVSVIASSKKELNFKEKFNIFYLNTVAGWGVFSIIISYNEWYKFWPQVVFVIMVVTFWGYNLLSKLKDSTVMSKLIDFLISLKNK